MIEVIKEFEDQDDQIDDDDNNNNEEGLFKISYVGESIHVEPIFTVFPSTSKHKECS